MDRELELLKARALHKRALANAAHMNNFPEHHLAAELFTGEASAWYEVIRYLEDSMDEAFNQEMASR